MKSMVRKLFGLMRKAGHPVLWTALFIALIGNLYYRDRLYWETPSIPFQPFCNPDNDWEDHRPVRGDIEITDEFLVEVAHELAVWGVTLKTNLSRRIWGGPENSSLPPILIAPKDQGRQTIASATEKALFALRGKPPGLTRWKDGVLTGRSAHCEDIEGVYKKF
ncbi:hypothetical protein [Magnetospira sp. QH-2]|uniref:hypothetical protein n=1 Tax=Magnetospira sp. (strain QH-2) TaxID=1288970 RepID=UPI0003E816FA|nr:hypothetical protein [Magnetospira sp. QH-2]CCQ75663.1 protein of unknown function [Magnetospira sp. QH-2]